MAFSALRGAGLLIAAPVLGAVALHSIACTTDSGGEHGSDIPTLPELDGGARRLPDGGILLIDGAVIAPDDDDDDGGDGGNVGPPCTSGVAAVVAGNATTLTGSVKVKNSAWLGQSISGGAAKSKPSLVALGGAFIGVTQGPDDSLQALKYTTTWAAATTFGVGGVKGSPTLALTGATAHVVYSAGPGADTNYMHGVFDGTNWDAATELVAASQTDPSTASFGTVSAGLAALGDGLAFAENGSNNGLYARTWTSAASWSSAIAVDGAGSVGTAFPATPELVAVTGTYDAVILYADNNTPGSGGSPIAWATHTAGEASWGTQGAPPNEIATTAATSEKMAAVVLNGTSIILSFRSGGEAFYAIGTVGGAGVTWSTPAPVGGGAPIAVDSVAAVAKGICGTDAIFAFSTAGVVKTMSLTVLAGPPTWTAPQTVTGASGTNLAIATMP